MPMASLVSGRISAPVSNRPLKSSSHPRGIPSRQPTIHPRYVPSRPANLPFPPPPPPPPPTPPPPPQRLPYRISAHSNPRIYFMIIIPQFARVRVRQ